MSNFEYNPGPTIAEQNGLGWSWGTGSEIARNGGFLPGGVQNAPDGSQAAILQQQSSFSQSLAGISSGLYSFSFYAEGRNFAQGSNPFQVEIDGTPLSFGALGGTLTPPVLSTFTFYQSDSVVLSAGSHQISFIGTNAGGPSGDRTSFIDLVNVTAVPEPASLPLLLLGGVSLLNRRRRK